MGLITTTHPYFSRRHNQCLGLFLEGAEFSLAPWKDVSDVDQRT